MGKKLKPFQVKGKKFLVQHRKALLADEMRLGKTVQGIEAAKELEVKTVLVVCPAVALMVWQDETVEWELDLPVVEINHQTIAIGPAPKIVVVSYEGASIFKKLLTSIKWDLLILDESHYLKSPDALRTATVYGKDGLVRHTKRIWCFSGTPAPNNVSELWTMMYTFGYTRMLFEDFKYYYCNVHPITGKVLGTKKSKRAELKRILKKFMLRRLKKTVAPELPSAVIERWPIKADLKMVDTMFPLDSSRLIREADLQTAKLLKNLKKYKTDKAKLRHLDMHIDEYATLRRITGILKVGAVFELIKHEITHKEVKKLVVFAYHTQVIEGLLLLLKEAGINATSIYGKTTPKQRKAAVKSFRGKRTHVAVCQIQSAGIAIDLSCADEGLLVERDWVPGNNLQAIERMGGFKQTSDFIRIRDIVIAGSIDDLIFKTLDRKTNELIEVFDK